MALDLRLLKRSGFQFVPNDDSLEWSGFEVQDLGLSQEFESSGLSRGTSQGEKICRLGRKVHPRKGNALSAFELFTIYHLLFTPLLHAPVAQLDRVPDYESGGRTFESCRVHISDPCGGGGAPGFLNKAGPCVFFPAYNSRFGRTCRECGRPE